MFDELTSKFNGPTLGRLFTAVVSLANAGWIAITSTSINMLFNSLFIVM